MITTTIGKYKFQRLEDLRLDYERYSKSWHRAHGPVREISNRRVRISVNDARYKSGEKVLAVVPFDTWAGNVELRAIKKSGIFPPPASVAPLSVRLDAMYSAVIVREIAGVSIYSRALLGQHVDYCALAHGVTYHADTPRAAVVGLRAKLKQRALRALRARDDVITRKKCIDLGFCSAGIKSFCEAAGISINGAYTREDIRDIVSAMPWLASVYAYELNKMGVL